MKSFKEMLALFESKEFNDYDSLLFSDYYELNKNTYDNKASNLTYTADSEYHDELGEKWRYVKKRDYTTIALAVIDGMCDKGEAIVDRNLYKSIKSKQDLDNITMNKPVVRRLINYINGFLEKYKTGRTKVYRGFNISAKEFESLPLKDRMAAALIERFDNTGKEYSSYTVDRQVAISFATGNALGARRLKEDTYAILIEGTADPNDICFAYTAYLIARHGHLNESELNINCFKSLSNQDVIIKKIHYNRGSYEEF